MNSMETITNRLDQEEEGISRIDDKIDEVSYSNSNKVKKAIMTTQKFWNRIKRPNSQICGVEDGTETQTKGTEILFIEITAENYPSLGNKWTSKYRIYLEPQVDMTRKILSILY
jgi:hypothetical protein